MTRKKFPNNIIYCCQCGTNVQCNLVFGCDVYPHRSDLKHIAMYECPICHNRVGTHKGTTKALGCIPTPEIKKARIKVHALIDPLWKSGKIKRSKLYALISKEVGYNYHTGNSRTLEDLREVYKVGLKIRKELDE